MHYVSDPITTRAIHRSGESGFCPTHNSSGGWFFNPQPTRNNNRFVGSGHRRVVVGFKWNQSHQNPSKCSKISPDLARSYRIWRDLAAFRRIGKIHPRSDEIPSDPARFLPYRDEKALVQLDPVFIMPKIIGFKWKRGWNLEKMGWNLEKSGQNLEKWSEFGKNGRILNGLQFGSGFMGFELKNR